MSLMLSGVCVLLIKSPIVLCVLLYCLALLSTVQMSKWGALRGAPFPYPFPIGIPPSCYLLCSHMNQRRMALCRKDVFNMLIYPASYLVVYEISGSFSTFRSEYISVAQNYFWHCVLSGNDYVSLKAVTNDDAMVVCLMAYYKDEEEGDADV